MSKLITAAKCNLHGDREWLIQGNDCETLPSGNCGDSLGWNLGAENFQLRLCCFKLNQTQLFRSYSFAIHFNPFHFAEKTQIPWPSRGFWLTCLKICCATLVHRPMNQVNWPPQTETTHLLSVILRSFDCNLKPTHCTSPVPVILCFIERNSLSTRKIKISSRLRRNVKKTHSTPTQEIEPPQMYCKYTSNRTTPEWALWSIMNVSTIVEPMNRWRFGIRPVFSIIRWVCCRFLYIPFGYSSSVSLLLIS